MLQLMFELWQLMFELPLAFFTLAPDKKKSWPKISLKDRRDSADSVSWADGPKQHVEQHLLQVLMAQRGRLGARNDEIAVAARARRQQHAHRQDAQRDPQRDAPQDAQRDSQRDAPQDAQRDSQRDAQRDSQRDATRDSQRDAKRDSPQDSPRRSEDLRTRKKQ